MHDVIAPKPPGRDMLNNGKKKDNNENVSKNGTHSINHIFLIMYNSTLNIRTARQNYKQLELASKAKTHV